MKMKKLFNISFSGPSETDKWIIQWQSARFAGMPAYIHNEYKKLFGSAASIVHQTCVGNKTISFQVHRVLDKEIGGE